jgi:large subunit ribosomal protein L27
VLGAQPRDIPGHVAVSRGLAGQTATAGKIRARQCGIKMHPDRNLEMGRDYALYAPADSVVKYETFRNVKRRVSIEPSALTQESSVLSKSSGKRSAGEYYELLFHLRRDLPPPRPGEHRT